MFLRNSDVEKKTGILHFNRFSNKTFLWILAFDALVFVLAHFVWPNINSTQFTIYKYVLNTSVIKTFVCILLSLIIVFITSIRYVDNAKPTFSNRVCLLLTMLYFLPGLAVCSALGLNGGYIVSFVAYYAVLIVADALIARPNKPFSFVAPSLRKAILLFLIAVCLAYPFVMMLVYKKTFSFDDFVSTINDPYETRAQSKEMGIPWAFMILEYWGVYFGSLMIVKFIKRRNFLLVALFVVVEMFYFSLQGNRVFVFTTILAIIFGFLNVKEKYFGAVFVGLLVIQLIEFAVFGNGQTIGLVTNIFRRYSIVPNVISPYYYDYFLTEQPDYLRGTFTNISNFLGLQSPYDYNIGYAIGHKYFGIEINANTGMIGGSLFEFGFLGILLDPILLVLSLRLFDKVLLKSRKEIVMVTAIIYATLAINSWAIWSQCIRVSYILVLIISICFLDGISEEKQISKGSRIQSQLPNTSRTI